MDINDNSFTQLETFEDAVDETLRLIRKTLIAKQTDYGPSNISKFGEFGVLVRASDKVERLTNLRANNKKPMNESVVDTWLDVAGYGVIGLMILHGVWGLPMEERDSR